MTLTLTTTRTISGHDARRGYFHHPRSQFTGDENHEYLPPLLFPRVDEAIEQTLNTSHHTEYGFLSLLKNLIWVILQDAAVMIGNSIRSHYVYDEMFKEVFHPDAFKDYTAKMLIHLSAQ